MNASLSSFPRLALFTVAYSLAVAASEYMYGSLAFPSPFWVPDSVLLCALLLTRRHEWWYLLALVWPLRLLAGAPEGTPTWFLLAGIANDSLKGVLAAWWLQRSIKGFIRLNTFHQMLTFFGIAAFAVPALSASVAAPLRYALGNPLWDAWYGWFMGNALTQIVVTPMLFYWCTRRDWSGRRRPEWLLQTAGLCAVIYFAFVVPHGRYLPGLLYAPVPFLLWAAVRLRPFGTANSVALVAAAAVLSGASGTGVFAGPSAESLRSIQLFLLVVGGSMLLLSTLLSENEAAEARFRLVIDTVPVLLWMSGPHERYVYFNKAWLDFTGRAPDTPLGDGWIADVHPDDRPIFRAAASRALAMRSTFKVEFRLRRHDGVDRWVVGDGVPRFDADGALTGYVYAATDITDRREAERHGQELASRLISAQEQERTRIARELHDDFGQMIALLTVELEALRLDMMRGARGAERHLDGLSQTATSISIGIHNLSHQLHPSILGVLGLPAALKGLCRTFSAQHHLEVGLTHQNVPERLSPEVSLALFRIAQEALRNVVKHGAVDRASIDLRGQNGELELRISDAGAGFDVERVYRNSGLGLVSMRERLRLIGGQLSIHSAPRGGTEIIARAPIPADAAAPVSQDVISPVLERP